MAYTKVLVSNNIVEVYEYEFKPNTQGGGRTKERSKRSEEIRKQTVKEARNKIRRLALANFNRDSKFLTLTFADGIIDYTNVKECNAYFKKFIRRLRTKFKNTKYKDFEYLAVIEFQDKNGRGAVHYHLLINIPYVPNAELQKIWGGGFVRINALKNRKDEQGHRLKDVDNIGAYITKYMMKDTNDTRLLGEKSYLISKNLKHPIEYKGKNADAFIHLNKLDRKKEVYASEYNSEHLGKITYKEYNTKRKEYYIDKLK